MKGVRHRIKKARTGRKRWKRGLGKGPAFHFPAVELSHSVTFSREMVDRISQN